MVLRKVRKQQAAAFRRKSSAGNDAIWRVPGQTAAGLVGQDQVLNRLGKDLIGSRPRVHVINHDF